MGLLELSVQFGERRICCVCELEVEDEWCVVERRVVAFRVEDERRLMLLVIDSLVFDDLLGDSKGTSCAAGAAN